jgi:hypothetical protein
MQNLRAESGEHEIHPFAFVEGHREAITQFDYRSLDPDEPEDMVSFSDLTACFSLVLQWACGQNRNRADQSHIIGAGIRVHALLFLLDPTHARYQSLADIARDAGVTRAAVCKAIIRLRKELGDIIPGLRSMQARENYRQAQRAAIAAGVHSSHRKRQKQQAAAQALSEAVIAE